MDRRRPTTSWRQPSAASTSRPWAADRPTPLPATSCSASPRATASKGARSHRRFAAPTSRGGPSRSCRRSTPWPTISTPGRASAARTARACPWGADPPPFASPGSPWVARVADLTELAGVAVEAARDHESVEAYAEEARRTEVTAHKGEVEELTFAESRGVGIRLIANGRWGYAYAADPALAEEDGETQAGWSFRVARELGELDWGSVANEAVERSARLLGAVKPASGRVPVVLDPFAGSSFLGVLAGALSAESVQKQRSLFADLLGEAVGSPLLTLVDDGRTLDGPAAAPFDDEGVPTGRTELIAHGTLMAFLHNTYTARRGATDSTGNAKRGGYRTPPGVGTTNFFVLPGATPVSDILRQAEGGVLIQDVSGVHSGANPISGEFSVGATGLRIQGGEVGEPLREMTVASTVPEMLKGIAAVGDDLRFFTAVGVPTILIAEMTVAGV